MDRRKFLRASAYASAAMMTSGRSAFAADADIEITANEAGPIISPHLYGQVSPIER